MAVLGVVVLMGRGGLRTPREVSAIELPLLRAVVAAVSVIVWSRLVEAAYHTAPAASGLLHRLYA